MRSFLKPLTVTANAATQTYNGLVFSGGNGVSYSVANPSLSGSLAYSGASQGARNVNAHGYAITPSGYFSDQQGYDVSYVDGTLTITARPLTVTAAGVNKVYDGLTSATVTYADNRVAGDVLTPGGSATYLDKNVGIAKTVNVSGITLTGTDAGNYTFNTTAATSADITPAR